MSYLKAQLRSKLLMAQEEAKESVALRCLTDQPAQRMAQKLFTTHVDEEDLSKFPAFIRRLDQLLCEFGGGKKEKDEKEEDTDKE